jgi:hypothetical protein
MRIERILVLATALLLAAGFVVWAMSGGGSPPRSSITLWLAALAISAVPLFGLVVYALFGRGRKRDPKA